MIRPVVALLTILLLAPGAVPTGEPRTDKIEGPDQETLALIKTAWTIADRVREDVWQGWSSAAPEILLVEDGVEYLIGPRALPEGFERLGPAPRDDWTIARRPAVFDAGLLATFPAFGPPATIIMGTPEATGRSPTSWVVTLLHENFHQYQYSQPGYYEGTAGLGLAEDENDGMWMLNYPFPYESADTGAAFDQTASALLAALEVAPGEQPAAACDYLAAKLALGAVVSEKDYRYLNFQLWQEGLADYTSYQIAKAAADILGPEYAKLADDLRDKAMETLGASGVLKAHRRVAFYPLGHLEGALLDQVSPRWKARYFAEPFQTDSLFPCPG